MTDRPSMNVLVIGGSGFIGKRLIKAFKKKGIDYTIACRGITYGLEELDSKFFLWDTNKKPCKDFNFNAFTHFVHIPDLAQIKFPEQYLKFISSKNFKRNIFISSTNILTNLPAASKPKRVKAESLINETFKAYTILRPTMIYGGLDDRNMTKLKKLYWRLPFVPLIEKGKALQQPVHVEDVVEAIILGFENSSLINKTLTVSGKTPLPFKDVAKILCGSINKKARFLNVPSTPIFWIFRLLEIFHIPFPFKSEQILRLKEDKAFASSPPLLAAGFKPREFSVHEVTING